MRSPALASSSSLPFSRSATLTGTRPRSGGFGWLGALDLAPVPVSLGAALRRRRANATRLACGSVNLGRQDFPRDVERTGHAGCFALAEQQVAAVEQVRRRRGRRPVGDRAPLTVDAALAEQPAGLAVRRAPGRRDEERRPRRRRPRARRGHVGRRHLGARPRAPRAAPRPVVARRTARRPPRPRPRPRPSPCTSAVTSRASTRWASPALGRASAWRRSRSSISVDRQERQLQQVAARRRRRRPAPRTGRTGTATVRSGSSQTVPPAVLPNLVPSACVSSGQVRP